MKSHIACAQQSGLKSVVNYKQVLSCMLATIPNFKLQRTENTKMVHHKSTLGVEQGYLINYCSIYP